MKSTRTLAALAALLLVFTTACSDDPEPGSNNDSNNISNNGANNGVNNGADVGPGGDDTGGSNNGGADDAGDDTGSNDTGGDDDTGSNDTGGNDDTGGDDDTGSDDTGSDDTGNGDTGDDEIVCEVRLELKRGLVVAMRQLTPVEAGTNPPFCWDLPVGEQAPRQWRFQVEREENALAGITEWEIEVGLSGEVTGVVYGQCPDGTRCTDPKVLTPGTHFVHIYDADDSFGLAGSTVFEVE